MSYEPSSALERAIEGRDFQGMRSSIHTMLNADPTNHFRFAQDAVGYLYDRGLGYGLWEEHDGELMRPYSDWTEEYYLEQLSALERNFSEKRFEHILSIQEKMAEQEKNSGTIDERLKFVIVISLVVMVAVVAFAFRS